jgi:hypothetical protein
MPLLVRSHSLRSMISKSFDIGLSNWMTGLSITMERLVSTKTPLNFSCSAIADRSIEPSEADKHGILILLQYHLHKLFVLFIYHPARGFDLVTHNIASVERHELLISARAVLRLQHNDTGIWSNWDLVVGLLFAFDVYLRNVLNCCRWSHWPLCLFYEALRTGWLIRMVSYNCVKIF